VTKPIDRVEAEKIVGEFLASKPLYSPLTITLKEPADEREDFYPSSLRKHCAGCKEPTNWARRGVEVAARRSPMPGRVVPPSHEGGHLLSYQCVQCEKEVYALWVRQSCIDGAERRTHTISNSGLAAFSHGTYGTTFEFRKFGQWKPWAISPDPELTSALAEADGDLYRKALMNMSTSYGLGALAYLRRVVENEVERLLEVVEEAAKLESDPKTMQALEKAKTGRNADEKLRLIADATPAFLRVGGLNPLKSLYDAFSAGIHGKTDEECLVVAEKLRAWFEYVFKNVRAQARARAELARALTASGQ
jgi:hypothetical protein